MLIAWVAIRSPLHLEPIAPDTNDTNIPPFWIVAEKKRTDGNLSIAAFVVFWYGNLLIAARTAKVRDAVQAAILRGGKDA